MKGYTKKPEINCEIGKEKGTFIKWVKVHKKELIFTGISIASLIGITIGIKNRDSIKELWAVLQKNISKTTPDTAILKATEDSIPSVEAVCAKNIISFPQHREYKTVFDVSGHIPNLYEGWNASPEKIAAAAAHGIELLPGQTWIGSYTKGVSAA